MDVWNPIRFEEIEKQLQAYRQMGLLEAFVQARYQQGHRGSKAILVLSGRTVHAWFWWYFPEPGSLVFLSLNVGYGSHADSHQVYYVGSEAEHGVHGEIRQGT